MRVSRGDRSGRLAFAHRSVFRNNAPQNSRQATLYTAFAASQVSPQVVSARYVAYLLGSPRKQGLRPHAITDRPTTLTPSISSRLGVSSQHQKLHRCALQRIFRPAFETGVPTRILHHLLMRLYHKPGSFTIKTAQTSIYLQFIHFRRPSRGFQDDTRSIF